MSRLPLLPKWVLPPTMPSNYDHESATALEMVAKCYGAMRKVVEDYNTFVDEINEEIKSFTSSSNEEIANFKQSVDQRLACKFKDLDALLAKITLEIKKNTDDKLEKAFSVFGVTVRETGENIILSDATDEKIRALSIYGKTTQSWEPVPEYPAELRSAGSSGSVTVKISNGKDEQLLTIATPEELPGIPVSEGGNYTDPNGQQWICDEIDLKKGVYIQRIDNMTLTGEEKFIRDSESWASGCYKVYTRTNNPGHVHRESMCSFLPTKANTDLANNRAAFGIGTHGNECLMVRFGTDKTEEQTSDLWKKAIQAGGEVFTVLQEPIERPLTIAELAAYKKLHTYMPDTTISNGSGAGMLVEYVAITQKYLENRITDQAVQITTQLVNEAIQNGKIVVSLEYNEETEEANIVAGGEIL